MALDLKKLFPGLSGGDGGDDLATKLKKIQDAIGRNAEISIDAPSQPLGTSIVNRPIEEVPSAPLDASPAFLSNQSDDDPAWGMAREAAKARQRNQLMARRAQMPAQIAAPDPMYGGRGDAAIPAGANWSMQNEMERAGQQTAANNAQVMAAAQRYAGMKIPNADETGYAATGRNLPDAITDEGPPPPGYAEYLRRTGNTGIAGQPRTSTDISNQILDVQANYKDPHKHSLLGRLFKGMGKAWKQWEPSDGGGLIGLGLSMLGGGIGSAASPEIYADYEKKDRLKKLYPQLGILRQQEDFANKQRTEQMQASNYQSLINDRNTDNARADYQIQEDARKVTPKLSNGSWFNVTAKGAWTPIYDEKGRQRTELTDVPIATQLRDGTPVWSTGDKIIDREIAENYRQAQMDFQAGQLNQADLDAYDKDMTKYRNDIVSFNNDRTKLIADGEAKQREARMIREQADNADDPAAARLKAATLESEGGALIDRANKAQAPIPPKRPRANIVAPNLNVGTYSEEDFIKRAKAKGITGVNLQNAIAKARQDGVIK